MSKPYTPDAFSDLVTADRTWRIREISDLKSAIKRADEVLSRVLLRALVALAYAHWEGHVKNSAALYMSHVALRKFEYANLSPRFLKNYFMPRMAALSSSKTSLAARCSLLDDIFSSSNRRFSKVNEDLINTRSNLNSEVPKEICLVCDISFENFEPFGGFVDTILLKRRNSIAHGEDTFIAKSDLDDISLRTIGLMRMFSEALEDKVHLKSYLVA